MPPMDVMTAGRMSVVADPSGAVFSLWQNGIISGRLWLITPIVLLGMSYRRGDIDGSTRFYTETVWLGVSG